MTGREPFPFGKYKGTPIKDAPKDYRNWVSGQDWAEDKIADILDYWSFCSNIDGDDVASLATEKEKDFQC